MLADVMRRSSGILAPSAVFDDFNRADSSTPGTTSDGNATWEEWRGDWSISDNHLSPPSSPSNPVVVIPTAVSDVDISLDVSSTGRDAIIFRATDADNYLRLANYYNQSTTTIYRHRMECCLQGTNCTEQCGMTTYTPCGEGGCPSCGSEGEQCQCYAQACDTETTTTRRIYLDRVENGSVSLINSHNVSVTSKIRVVANGDQIECYTGTNLRFTRTEAFNLDATYHGVGRRSSGNDGSAINTFSLQGIGG